MDNSTDLPATDDNSTADQSWNGDDSSPSTNLTILGSNANHTQPADWLSRANSSSTTSSPLPYPTTFPSNVTKNFPASATPLISSMTSSQVISDALPSQSAISNPINPNVMGHIDLDSTMWRQPGIIIGITCAILGIFCLVAGIVYGLRKKRHTRSIRGLRVVSGFDFNGGDEDDYHIWDIQKPPMGKQGEKAQLELNGSLTAMGAYRHSVASIYSNDDEADLERIHNSSSPAYEKGIAM